METANTEDAHAALCRMIRDGTFGVNEHPRAPLRLRTMFNNQGTNASTDFLPVSLCICVLIASSGCSRTELNAPPIPCNWFRHEFSSWNNAMRKKPEKITEGQETILIADSADTRFSDAIVWTPETDTIQPIVSEV